MSGPRRQTPRLLDRRDGQGRAAGKQSRASLRRRSPGQRSSPGQRRSPGQLLLAFLALPTPLDHGDDGEHRADPEADKRTLAQLESGTKALQMTSKG